MFKAYKTTNFGNGILVLPQQLSQRFYHHQNMCLNVNEFAERQHIVLLIR